MNTIGERLKLARNEALLTQDYVAAELKITQSALSKYENNMLEPNLDTLCKLIDLYGVSANWLLGVGKYMDD